MILILIMILILFLFMVKVHSLSAPLVASMTKKMLALSLIASYINGTAIQYVFVCQKISLTCLELILH